MNTYVSVATGSTGSTFENEGLCLEDVLEGRGVDDEELAHHGEAHSQQERRVGEQPDLEHRLGLGSGTKDNK